MGALPIEPDDVALHPLVEALVEYAESAPTRKMGSVQAMLREHGRGLPEEVRGRLVSLTSAELTQRERERPKPQSLNCSAPSGEWLGLRAAAARLGIREEVLSERLHRPADRRRYGYPRWDGYQWWFSSLAIDPSTSAAFLASMPTHEGVPELLPDWCIREGQERAPRDAKTDEERIALRWPKLAPQPS